MMRSLFSGVTGLRSHQTRMDVIGNNIANVNTIGFKKSVANFADIYSETVSPASAPTAYQGSTNAQQIGLGTSVNSIVVKHSPGAAQYTGNTLDLAITGDGFFVLETPQGNRYTRAGDFGVGTTGILQNQSGYYVQGYNSAYIQGTAGTAEAEGIAGKLTASLENFGINFTAATNGDPTQTSAGTYTFSLGSPSGPGNTYLLSDIKVYKNGLEIPVAAGDITLNGSSASTATFNATGTPNTLSIKGLGNITFDTKAAPITTPSLSDGLAELKNILDNAEIQVKNNDGFQPGTNLGRIEIDPDLYENVSITKDGAVVAQTKASGIYNGVPMGKGEKVILGYVALATFVNNEGLEKVGTNMYQQTPSSGVARMNVVGQNGAGSLNPSSLEMSNVDLSEEMVNMIITQRGFQANSRIITTSDSLLEELVNLKR